MVHELLPLRAVEAVPPTQRVEVLVVWNDVAEPSDAEAEQWSMADLVGLLEDGDLERQPQGEYEKRDPIT